MLRPGMHHDVRFGYHRHPGHSDRRERVHVQVQQREIASFDHVPQGAFNDLGRIQVPASPELEDEMPPHAFHLAYLHLVTPGPSGARRSVGHASSCRPRAVPLPFLATPGGPLLIGFRSTPTTKHHPKAAPPLSRRFGCSAVPRKWCLAMSKTRSCPTIGKNRANPEL
jgi:hypothetical protein